jgi:type VI protein secretion system component Hcp
VILKLIDGSGNPIKDESKVPGHENEIDIAAWSWGVTAPAGAELNILDISIKKSSISIPQCFGARPPGMRYSRSGC